MSMLTQHDRSPLFHLRIRWFLFALSGFALLGGGYIYLLSRWAPEYALRWLGLSSVFVAYQLWVLWRGLPENIRPGEVELLPVLGLGNILTLLRGSLVAALAGFLFSPRPEGWQAWIPGLLYTLATLLDYVDGWAARATGHATRLGERLDLSLDGVGVFIAALLAVQYGQAPAGYLAVALARPLFLACLWLWQRSRRPVYPLPHSYSRRAFAGLQMGFLSVLLWPLFSPPATHVAATLVALPFLIGFARDGLLALGLLRPGSRANPQWTGVARWFPLLLRLAAAGLIFSLLIGRFLGGRGSSFFGLLDGLELVVAFLLLLGAAGRLTAILGLILLGVQQMSAPLSAFQIVLAGLFTALLYLGTGAFSLWKPEDRLITRRAGEQRPVATERDLAHHRSIKEQAPGGSSHSGPASPSGSSLSTREA